MLHVVPKALSSGMPGVLSGLKDVRKGIGAVFPSPHWLCQAVIWG